MVAHGARSIRSGDEDSARWLGFEFRHGDIVISTRSKHGTTWVQMICALLIFRSPRLPRPLPDLSPWLDWLVQPEGLLFEHLDAQTHRRFIKTHTPLDGLPLDDRAQFIVVARHPLDAAVSLYHQSRNIDRRRVAELTCHPEPMTADALPAMDSWLRTWIASDADPLDELDSFNGVLHHLTDAWKRRDDPNVTLIHYADLIADLPNEMRRIAAELEIDVPDHLIDELWAAATFDTMRANAAVLAPDPAGVLRDTSRFFRAGRSGDGMEILGAEDIAAYLTRAAATAPDELLTWLHRH